MKGAQHVHGVAALAPLSLLPWALLGVVLVIAVVQRRRFNRLVRIMPYSARFRALRTKSAPPVVLVIDGPIASGKSTLLRVLKHTTFGLSTKVGDAKVVFIEEPVDVWTKVGILQQFYAQVKEWAYRFQTFVFVTRIEAIQRAVEAEPNADIYVLERSIFSDRFLFVDMLIDSGKMLEIERQMYLEWWRCWRHAMPFLPDGFVFLNVPATECNERKLRRNRDGEKPIDVEYNEALRLKHVKFFDELLGTSVPLLTLTPAQTGNYADNDQDAERVCQTIASFVSDRIGNLPDNARFAARDRLLALGP